MKRRFLNVQQINIWMFPQIGGFPPKSSILMVFSIINHPFWGFSPYFWEAPRLFRHCKGNLPRNDPEMGLVNYSLSGGGGFKYV